MECSRDSRVHESMKGEKHKMTTREKLQTEAKRIAEAVKVLTQVLEEAATTERPTEDIFAILDFAFEAYDGIGNKINEVFTPLFEKREATA